MFSLHGVYYVVYSPEDLGGFMADEADIANDYIERVQEAAMRMPRPEMAKGTPGECDWCGEDSPRLVNKACARCRDEYRLD